MMSCNIISKKNNIKLINIIIAIGFALKENLFYRFVYYDYSIAINPIILFLISV